VSCAGRSLQGVETTVCDRIEALINALSHFGYSAWITSGYRDSTRQAALYQRWISGRSKYPAQPPGKSLHERGLAVDIGSTAEGLEVAGFLAPYVGLTWGGHFTHVDPVHFELRL